MTIDRALTLGAHPLTCWCKGPWRKHDWAPDGGCPTRRVFIAESADYVLNTIDAAAETPVRPPKEQR